VTLICCCCSLPCAAPLFLKICAPTNYGKEARVWSIHCHALFQPCTYIVSLQFCTSDAITGFACGPDSTTLVETTGITITTGKLGEHDLVPRHSGNGQPPFLVSPSSNPQGPCFPQLGTLKGWNLDRQFVGRPGLHIDGLETLDEWANCIPTISGDDNGPSTCRSKTTPLRPKLGTLLVRNMGGLLF
jgi:hypothetical protein